MEAAEVTSRARAGSHAQRHQLELCTISPAACLELFDILLERKGPKVFEEQAALREAWKEYDASLMSDADQDLPPLEAAPLVSCLMVSRNGLPLVRRSIDAFVRQTYAHKELIIVRDPVIPPGEVEAYVRALGRCDVRLVRPPVASTLSRLRNVSIDSARGDVLCQWDDDDISHPDRLRIQLAAMRSSGTPASFLQDAFDYYMGRGELYWAHWGHIWLRCLPGTIMFRRTNRLRYADSERFSQKTEDTLFYLHLRSAVVIGGAPYLYVYSFHDSNTWSETHRRDALARCLTSMGSRVDEFVERLEPLGLRTSHGASGAAAYLAVDEERIPPFEDDTVRVVRR